MKVFRASKGSKSAIMACREHETSKQTLYHWKRKYAGIDVHDSNRLKKLEEENRWFNRTWVRSSRTFFERSNGHSRTNERQIVCFGVDLPLFLKTMKG